MPSISKRGVEVPLSPFRKLVPIADKVKAEGKHVYHLNIGQPDIETPAAAMAKVKNTDLKILAYSAAAGNASYRAKLVEYYAKFGANLTTEQVTVTTGASEAIQFLFMACMDHGDEMVVPEPFYANYNGFAHIADINVVPVTCALEDGFALPDAKAFEAVITPKTKAIFITNPNNPTGCFYPEKALKELAQVVKKYDLYLFVDEVYREFCYDDEDFFSVLRLEEIENNVVVIDSVSKRYSACGARVGAMVTRNEELTEAVVKYAKLRLSPPGLGQLLAEGALEMDDSYINQVKEEYDQRRKVVFERLQQMDGVISYLPGGAFYCFAEFPIENADHFCQWLLEKFDYKGATVMLSPGEGFYATPGLGTNQVRIAYVLNPRDLHAAMDCLEEALQVYPGRIPVGQSVEGTAVV